MNCFFRWPTAIVSSAVIVAWIASSALAASSPKFDEQEQIGILQGQAPAAEKALACKRLAVSGTYRSVPALEPLLADEQLASWARIALEAIADSAADEALRRAAEQLKGKLLVGVINSIGVRRDAGAVELLIRRLNDADAEVAAAAAVALGRIAVPSGVKALEESFPKAPAPVRAGIAKGLVLAAERAFSGGAREEALRLYRVIEKSDAPKAFRLAALRGVVLADKGNAGEMIVSYLNNADKDVFGVGLWLAREVEGPEVTKALVGCLKSLPAERQSAVVSALADRNDSAAIPTLLQAAGAGDVSVRLAAITALGKVGGVSAVPVLLSAATDPDPRVAEKAIDALIDARGNDIDAQLAERMASAQGPLRKILIQLAGARYITAAKPLLLKAADDPDAEIRTTALMALGAVIGSDELPWLVERVKNPPRAEDAKAAETALRMAAVRMPDREACALLIRPLAESGPNSRRISALEILAAIGGRTALEVVAAAAKNPDAEIQDAGSRVLGEWMSVDAAPILLDLAKSAAENKYRIRALRGYIRLARQLDLPVAQRLEMCREAILAAQRPDEKRLVLDVLRRQIHPASLDAAVGLLTDPQVKQEAAQTILAISEKMIDSEKLRVSDALGKVIEAGVGPDLTARAKALQSRAIGSQ